MVIHELGSVLKQVEKYYEELYKMEGFIGRGRVGKQIISKRKERIVSGLVIFWGKGNGRGLITCVTFLVLIRKFQIIYLKVTFLGKVEMAMKSWFVLLGLNDSILNL